MRPPLFEETCKAARQDLRLRMQEGYDHSCYTMETFMEDQIMYHAKVLGIAI